MTTSRSPVGMRGAGWVVALVVTVFLIATEPWMAMVWDEGFTLGRQERLRLWFRALRDPAGFAANWQPPSRELLDEPKQAAPPPRPDQIDTRAKLLFDPQVLAWFWPFAREEPHGHPPFYALVGLVGDVLTPWRPMLARARLGPILAFSLTAGALFAFMLRRWGFWPALAAVSAWVLQPNLFAHGHYATYDALLSCLWLSSVLAFQRVLEAKSKGIPWGRVAILGLLLGCAADTKLTGWFIVLPLLAWSVVYRSRRGFQAIGLASMFAGVVLLALNPPWWTEPIVGVTRFLASNLGRSKTIRIKVMFLGQIISTPDGSLPWYNTLAWTLFVTPVGFLGLGIVGLGRAWARRRMEPIGVLVAGNWAFLMLLRSMPHTPGHDGVRQFLPAFGLLAVLAGLGAASVLDRIGTKGRGILALATAEGLVSLAVMGSVPLSYFSPLVGGLPGAAALGMEPTFYWDALDAETRAWLREHTQTGQKVRFATFPTSWLYLRTQGELPEGLLPSDPGVWTWYVLQNRPGELSPLDRALISRGQPARVVSRLGVPLIWVFPYEQVEALLHERR